MMPAKRLSIAPMMDYTDRHERYFLRLITEKTWLYTEMVTTNTVLHGNQSRILSFNQSEHPIALQLGGSDPKDLAVCSKIGEDGGYDEINLNVGCPSDRVKTGRFGACLMASPDVVASCVQAMINVVSVPVTVKCRLGIDDQDDYENLVNFVERVSKSGCTDFIVHARKAWLQGLSPKENRDVPPLRYDLVYRLKKDFPHLQISINGGITDLKQTIEHLEHVDGVMIGRTAYSNPYMLAEVDQKLYQSEKPIPTREDILLQYITYVDEQMRAGIALTQMSRHILGLFQGISGAKAWRRYISENAHKSGADTKVIIEAAKFVNIEI